MPEKSYVILHPSGHNPSGIDLTEEQWEKVADVMWEKKHIPIFDVSYQGFANDLETDVEAIRYFGRRNFNMFVV